MATIENIITENIDVWSSAIKQRNTQGRGSSKRQELYGVQKLRELILELAVRGLLVPQDTNDEPASVLLEKIAIEKEQLIKDKIIKQPRKTLNIRKEDAYYSLPESWCWIRLADIGHDWGQKIPDKVFTYIDVGAINKERGFIDNPSQLEASEAPSRARKIVKNGTVIYSTVRPYLLNIAIVDSHIDPEPIASTAFAVIHPFKGIDAGYVYRYLRSSTFIQYVESCQTGIAYPAINDKQFFSGLIPVPPLEEQKRIVAKVDELMALCDQLEQQQENSIAAHQQLVETLLAALTQAADNEIFEHAWSRIAANFETLFTTESSIDQLKQILLQLAVMGKLVPQDPSDEPASVLLEKIAAENEKLIKEKQIKKQKPLIIINADEKPFDIPSNWLWVRFGQLFKSFSNGLYKSAKHYTDDGIISLRMYNIQGGVIDFTAARRVKVEQKELEQFVLEEGDLLINRVNSKELVGKTALIPYCEEPLVYESMNMRAKPFGKQVHSPYLNLYMLSDLSSKQISAFAKEAVGQASINQGQVSSLLTPLPPLAEQKRIVEKVDQLFAICDQLKTKINTAQQTQLQLADAITSQAIQ